MEETPLDSNELEGRCEQGSTVKVTEPPFLGPGVKPP